MNSTGAVVKQQLRGFWQKAEPVLRKNPHFSLALTLFCFGAILLFTGLSTVSGALFGAGAALTGAWITELNTRQARAQERVETEARARRLFAPELKRTIERLLHVEGRAVVHFIHHSVAYACPEEQQGDPPDDEPSDFLPIMPKLYPDISHFGDLAPEDAIALVDYYDAIERLHEFISKNISREYAFSPRVNTFLVALENVQIALELGKKCVERFQVDTLLPPRYEAHGTLALRIDQCLGFIAGAREHHMKRVTAFHAKSKLS